jgi:multisubunit Na+/H+ antiporter MnhC subunit
MRFLSSGLLLAVMETVARAQVSTDMPSASPTPAIRDIRPPLDVFPYPMWMVVTAGVIGLAVLALVVAGLVRAARNRPAAPPPTARDIALRRLKEAEADIARLAPYAFSIQVSDILRQYVSAQYHLHATEQTSQEFLAEAAKSPHFTGADKTLLAEFLERCDLIKFAHVDATQDDSRALLAQAVKFVKGEAA